MKSANHSALKMDLQLFADFEDAILPDDFDMEDTSTQEESQTEEGLELESDTTQTEEQTDPIEEPEVPAKFKVKFNHEEKELGYDEAVPLIQKGMNYDKLQERLQALESDPRLSYVEKQAERHGLTVTEYLQAVEAQERQAELDDLVANNIPEEYAKEMLAARKDREERAAEKKAQEEPRTTRRGSNTRWWRGCYKLKFLVR